MPQRMHLNAQNVHNLQEVTGENIISQMLDKCRESEVPQLYFSWAGPPSSKFATDHAPKRSVSYSCIKIYLSKLCALFYNSKLATKS